MNQIHASYAAARQNPVRTGVFAVLGVLMIGVLAGFALGYDAPSKAWANMVAPITVAPPVVVSVTPIIVPITPAPVLPTPVTPITVTPPTSNPDTAPAPTTDTPTQVSPVVVNPPAPADDPSTDPCCTQQPTEPTPVTPVVVNPPTPTDDPSTDPCCTVTPETPVTPVVVPPVTPPVLPPVVPPQDFCPNRPDLDKNNLPDGYYVDDEGNCVTRPVTSVKQCVFLKGNNVGNGVPVVINPNQPFNLEWKTEGVSSISISNVDGPLPVTGSKVVYPTQNTTYVLSAPGVTGFTPCQVSVVISTVQQGPQCISLTADKARIKKGETVTLSWVIANATSIDITNVGTKTGSTTGSVQVTPEADTTYKGTVAGAPETSNCVAEVKIETDDTTCTSNCGGGGGGGGGGRRSPRVVLDSVTDFEEPLSFVYLSEVPYTGLELGTWGTVLYWIMLVGWSLALAYLVLFNAVPFALARAKTFGSNVKEAMNSDALAHGHDTHAAPAAHASHAPSGHGHAPAHGAHATPAAPAKPAGYNAHDGFRSFAAGEGLTIDDIVKGLSREIEQKHEVHAVPAPTHEEVLQAVHEEVPAAPIAYAAPKAAPAMAPMSSDVRDFIAALLNGDRDTVFGMIRSMARQGHDTEAFVSNAACALDDAYRACIDGTTCHPDIAELTSGCHPSYLERLVTSLATAVDGSYSAGMTGVKMALTRALGVVAG